MHSYSESVESSWTTKNSLDYMMAVSLSSHRLKHRVLNLKSFGTYLGTSLKKTVVLRLVTGYIPKEEHKKKPRF